MAHSSLVAQRADLHRRDLQEGREDDIRQGSLFGEPFEPLQFQPGRQHPARHRLPGSRQAGREGPEGALSGRCGLQQVVGLRLVQPARSIVPAAKTSKARKPAVLPKSDGGAGLQACIASLDPWQAAIAQRVDALVAKQVPQVRKAVRWHNPFCGIDGQGWFLAFAAFQHHIKFSFFKGTTLKPVPPIGQFKDVRSLDVREADKIDEKLLASWIKQAAALPGWDGGSATRYGGSAL